MDIVKYTDRFFAVERRLDLFSEQIDGVSWWDVARYEIYQLVYYHAAGMRAASAPDRAAHKRLSNYIIRKALKASLQVKARRRCDVVVFRCPRHQKAGRPADVVIDPVMTTYSGRVLTVDTYPHYYHRNIQHEQSTIDKPRLLGALIWELETEFGSPGGLEGVVMTALRRFHGAVEEYLQLLRAISPRAIVMVQHGIEKALFCAAHRLDLPVLEIQHGLIQYVHPAYSYPRDLNYGHLMTFPDYFLAFSQYWLDSCHYPVAHRVAVGNDHFFLEPQSTHGDGILFISGIIHDAVLRPWIQESAARLPHRKFIYKLHPNQLGQEHVIRAALRAPNIEVVGSERSVRDLFPATSAVVLIQSTVAHEALQAGKTLCILPLYDFQTHADLLHLPQVSVTATIEQLVSQLADQQKPAVIPAFFDRFDSRKTARLIADIIDPAPAGAVPLMGKSGRELS